MNNQTLTQQCMADVGHAHINRDGIEFLGKNDEQTVKWTLCNLPQLVAVLKDLLKLLVVGN